MTRRSNEALLAELSKLSDEEIRHGLVVGTWRSRRGRALAQEALARPKLVATEPEIPEPTAKVSAPKSSTKPVTKKSASTAKQEKK